MTLPSFAARWRRVLFAAPIPFAIPSASAEPERLSCRARHEDCGKELAIIEATIRTDPALAAIRREADERLAALLPQYDEAGRAALRADEERFRRSLRRELYILAGSERVDDADSLSWLRDALARRRDWLRRVDPAPAALDGVWAGAAGTVEIRHFQSADYTVTMDRVDTDFLAWTCEYEAMFRLAGPVLEARLDRGEAIRIIREGGVLLVKHTPPSEGVTAFCGARGSQGGVYFRLAPPG